MKTSRHSLAIALALAVAGSGSLAAQGRRTSSGGGGEGRSAPASSGSRGSSASAPSRGGGGGGSASAPGRSSGVSSGSADARRGGSTATGNGSSDARRGTPTASGTKGSTVSQSGRPASGKIGAIRDQAHAARNRGATVRGGGVFIGSCWSCNSWGWYGSSWGRYHGGWWYPAYYPPPDYYPSSDYPPPGGGSPQSYQPYPYASDSTGEAFVQSRAPARRTYGAFTMQYFSDVGSTTKAGSVALEGAIGALRGELEYSHYAEPVAGGTDHLHTLHVGIAAQPQLGRNAYLIAGVAARGLILDDGSHAWGPEGELGLQVFPMRPFGLNVTGRLAGLSWNGNDYFMFRELNTTGSVFINRVELMGGWHWMKIDRSPAFGGPMLGMRVWF